MPSPNVYVMGRTKGAINTAWHVEKQFNGLEDLIVCGIYRKRQQLCAKRMPGFQIDLSGFESNVCSAFLEL